MNFVLQLIHYRRNAYHHYLVNTVLEPITAVLQQKDLNLDINPVSVYNELVASKKRANIEFTGPENVSEEVASKNEEVQAIIQERIKLLDRHCRAFLNRIFATCASAPYSVRFMCKKIYEHGTTRYTDASSRDIYSLVGGLIFFRFFNPSITTCDSRSVNIVSVKLTSIERKNLTLICKVIQALSNGIPFGDKEQFMKPMNSIIEEYSVQIHQFFVQLCDVEEINERLEVRVFTKI
jgi:Ras GTPase-activating-like protein IQGAP2/3